MGLLFQRTHFHLYKYGIRAFSWHNKEKFQTNSYPRVDDLIWIILKEFQRSALKTYNIL